MITFGDNAINIHVFLSPEQEDMLKRRQRTENEDMVQRALRALEEGDPFSDTDLPVDSITQGRHARREN